MKPFHITLIAMTLSTGPALAAPVDLSTWTTEGTRPFILSADGFSATSNPLSQTEAFNFFGGGPDIQGQRLTARVTVDPTLPQRRKIGFALGFTVGENLPGAPETDYWLIDWQGADNTFFSGIVPAGLALSHVIDIPVNTTLLTHGRTAGGLDPDSPVVEVARGATLGSTGWTPGATHVFDILFTPSLIEIAVDDVRQFNLAGDFADGGFGFFANQPGATFSLDAAPVDPDPIDPDPVVTPAPIPVPAALPLLLSGFAALVALRRRRA